MQLQSASDWQSLVGFMQALLLSRASAVLSGYGRKVCCPVAADHSRFQTQIYQNLLICSRFNALKVILGENMLQAEFHRAEFPLQPPSGLDVNIRYQFSQ